MEMKHDSMSPERMTMQDWWSVLIWSIPFSAAFTRPFWFADPPRLTTQTINVQ
jgi:hypothetical protein